MESLIMILTTSDNKEVITSIGRALLEQRLVACVQFLGPMTSLYWWKDSVEETREWLAIMKTKATLYKKVESEIHRLHPYEVPQIVSIPIECAFSEYGKWIVNETG